MIAGKETGMAMAHLWLVMLVALWLRDCLK